MTRRRRKSSPFSLFSFQDIVTSVTAVIILITLILTLDLVTRQQASASSQLDKSVTELRAALEQAEAELRVLKQQLQDVGARTLQHASLTPEQRQHDIQQTNEQCIRLRNELEQLQLRQNAIKAQEEAVLARSLESDGLRSELDELRKRTNVTEESRKKILDGDQLIFNKPPGTSKRAWLVDISADVVVVLSFDSGATPQEFRAHFWLAAQRKCYRGQTRIARQMRTISYSWSDHRALTTLIRYATH